MTRPGFLIVVSGPSGVGKDTIVDAYLQKESNCVLSVSATTRNPREGELDGVHYHFMDESDFLQLVNDGYMLEYANYNGHYYGTPKNKVDELLEQGKHVILVIEIQGAQKIRKIRPDAVFVFLMPPSIKTLTDRLITRGTETMDDITRRIQAAYSEMEIGKGYDFIIINDDLYETVERFRCIITAAECSPKYYPDLLKGVNILDA